MTKIHQSGCAQGSKDLPQSPNDTSLYILLLFKLVMLPLLVTSALGCLAGFIRCKCELLILPSQIGHSSFPDRSPSNIPHINTWQLHLHSCPYQAVICGGLDYCPNIFFLPFCGIIHLHTLPRDFALTFSREGGIYLLLCPFDVGFGQQI